MRNPFSLWLEGGNILFLLGFDLRGKPPAQICTGVLPLEDVDYPGADTIVLVASQSNVIPDFSIYKALLILNIGFTLSCMS